MPAPGLVVQGGVYWATVPAGFCHDQGTRPWVVLSVSGPERVVALPISTDPPTFGYPLPRNVARLDPTADAVVAVVVAGHASAPSARAAS
jgi:hypothetical protein